MSLKQSVSVEDAINLLNELLELDAGAIGALVANRVPCNEGIADHYSVQVEQRNCGFNVGLLGIINGLFGIDDDGWGAITCEFDCGNLLKFRRVTASDKGNGKTLKDYPVIFNRVCDNCGDDSGEAVPLHGEYGNGKHYSYLCVECFNSLGLTFGDRGNT